MVHEVIGGQVNDVAPRLGRARRPGDGVEQVRFTQPDCRMDIDGIKAHRVVGGGMGHLLCHLQRHFIGAAGNKGLEGHLRIKRTARERIALGGRRILDEAWRRGQHGYARRLVGRLDHWGQARTGLAVDTYGKMQPRDGIGFLLEGFKDALGIIGLDPRAQETRRHGKVPDIVDDLLQLETSKPRSEDIFTYAGAQTSADPGKNFAIGVRSVHACL
jgi:hypothetical protein